MRRFALSVALALFSHATLAADLPLKAPVLAPASAYNWSGIYVGGTLGYGWAHANWAIIENLQGAGFGDSVPPDKFDNRMAGAIGGGQIGYNYQNGAWVFGAEALLAFSGIKGDHASTAGAADDQFTARIRTLVLGTGRIGYAWDRLLAYGKGGIAAARINASVSDNVGPVTGSGSATVWKLGPTLGLGFEYGITPNLSLAAEYNYIRLGSGSYQLGDASGSYLWDIKIRDVSLVMVKLNYRFK